MAIVEWFFRVIVVFLNGCLALIDSFLSMAYVTIKTTVLHDIFYFYGISTSFTNRRQCVSGDVERFGDGRVLAPWMIRPTEAKCFYGIDYRSKARIIIRCNYLAHEDQH